MQKYDWDASVPEDLETEWKSLRSDIKQLFDKRIPRYIGTDSGEQTLAVFSDASKKAYSTAVYLRCKLKDGEWISNLIFAKSRTNCQRKTVNCPAWNLNCEPETVTLRRLELLGLGSMTGLLAGEFCREGLRQPLMKIDFFTDSECVFGCEAGKC